MSENNRYIVYIGVVGQIAVGKGVLVDYLKKEFGFVSFSLSSIIHEEVKKRNINRFDRTILQDIGDDLRKQEGDAVLAKKAIETLKKTGKNKVVIEGIRNPGEIEYLKKNPNFILVGVKANRKLRFKRLLKRGKSWDPKNWNDFVKVDRRDLGIGQKRSGQQVGRCLNYCDFILTNNKDTNDFHRKVHNLLLKIFRLNGSDNLK